MVRLIIGKGGMGDKSLAAFSELGGAYLAIVGGAAALETTWIERIDDVDLDDLNPESLWRFAIRDFGPLLVAMDSHNKSLYDAVANDAQAARGCAAIARRKSSRRCTQSSSLRRLQTDILILGPVARVYLPRCMQSRRRPSYRHGRS